MSTARGAAAPATNSARGRNWAHPWAAVLAASAALATSCGQQKEPGFAAVKVPDCASIKRFGNGARCDGEQALVACEVGGAALCASGWLCFDAPKVAFCACASDEDCQGRATYINQARAKAKIAPLAARCVGGRCEGAP